MQLVLKHSVIEHNPLTMIYIAALRDLGFEFKEKTEDVFIEYVTYSHCIQPTINIECSSLEELRIKLEIFFSLKLMFTEDDIILTIEDDWNLYATD